VAYRLPTFNLIVNIWRNASSYLAPPDVVAAANFNVGKRVGHLLEGEVVPGFGPFGYEWLLLPIGTDIRGTVSSADFATTQLGDWVEIPAASGIFYACAWADRSALGFPNEHVSATVYRILGTPPVPAVALTDESSADLEEEASSALLVPE
jgi:hypothetical protein